MIRFVGLFSFTMMLIGSILIALGGYELALRTAHYAKNVIPSLISRARTTKPQQGAIGPTLLKSPGKFGPNAEFPFRSPVPLSDDLGLKVWVASASHGEDTVYRVDRIFPNLICSMLSNRDIKLTCLNSSRAGWTIQDNIEHFMQISSIWSPDYVVLYQSSLDIQRLSNKYLDNRYQQDSGANGTESRRPPFSAVLNQALRSKVEGTTAYKDGREFVGSVLLLNAPLAEHLPMAADQEFEDLLEHFIRVVRSQGAEPVLATFAISHDIDLIDAMPFRTKTWIMLWQTGLSARGFVATVDRYNNVIRRVAVREKILLVDLAQEIGGMPALFRDPVHFNPDGHRRAANAIASVLLDRL